VTFGIELWEKYHEHITVSDFKAELSSWISKLARHVPTTRLVDPLDAGAWPYPVGYFDNTGKSSYDPVKDARK